MSNPFRTPQAPSAPDPATQALRQQQGIDTSVATQNRVNRVDQQNQFGSTSDYYQTGTDASGNPTFGQRTTWGQPTQDFNSGLMGLGGQYINRAQNMLDHPADLSSTGAFNQAQQFWDTNNAPRLQQQEDAARNRLANQGFDPSSAGYRAQMDDVMRQQNQAHSDWMLGAQNTFNTQALANRNQQVGELTQLANPGLQAGFQGMNAGFQTVPGINVGTADPSQAYNNQFNQQQQIYGQQMAEHNAMLGGLAGLGGAALMAPMTGGTSLGGMMGGAAMGGFRGLGNAASSGYNYAFPPAYQNYAMHQQQGPV